MIEIQVVGMSCSHCVSAVTKSIQQLDPAARVAVDLEHGRVQVDHSTLAASAIERAIEDAGYDIAADR